MNALEVLEAAYATLNGRSPQEVIDDESWDFADWNRCTCGHIYGAALGVHPRNLVEGYYDGAGPTGVSCLIDDEMDVRSEERTYLEALEAVLKANGETANNKALHSLVSDLTAMRADQMAWTTDGEEQALLVSARELVSNAIEYLKNKYEEDRKAVAG